jgi:hypothetical protein
VASISTVYEYTPLQSRVVQLYDYYRTSLLNAKYYARRLEFWKRISIWSDCLIAVSASASFAGLAIWKSDLGKNSFTVILAIAAVLSALRPITRIPDKIDRVSKLHYGYLELYYRIEGLVSEMRSLGHVTPEQLSKAADLSDRFRAMELEGDAYQNPKILLKYQDEIERILPADRLWLPSD